MAWGLEVRVPFLDKDFLELAMTLDPNEKLCSKQHMEVQHTNRVHTTNAWACRSTFFARPSTPPRNHISPRAFCGVRRSSLAMEWVMLGLTP
jgi:asparagine synthetase B (glutamine-hydrolysing)